MARNINPNGNETVAAGFGGVGAPTTTTQATTTTTLSSEEEAAIFKHEHPTEESDDDIPFGMMRSFKISD